MIQGDEALKLEPLVVSAAPVPANTAVTVYTTFAAPEKIGEYLTFYRLVDPITHTEFGQKFWVDLQVKAPEDPVDEEPIIKDVEYQHQQTQNAILLSEVPDKHFIDDSQTMLSTDHSASKTLTDFFDDKTPMSTPANDYELKMASPCFQALDQEVKDNLTSLLNMGFTDLQKNLTYLQDNCNSLETVVIKLLDQQ